MLVQREMERRRSPLASVPPFGAFHVALGQLGLTIPYLLATIKRAISPEMNDIPPMNIPAITSFGLGQLPPHAQ